MNSKMAPPGDEYTTTGSFLTIGVLKNPPTAPIARAATATIVFLIQFIIVSFCIPVSDCQLLLSMLRYHRSRSLIQPAHLPHDRVTLKAFLSEFPFPPHLRLPFRVRRSTFQADQCDLLLEEW